MSLQNPNRLTTIPDHQPQPDHHLSLYIVTFITSFTLNKSNELFLSSHGNVPKLTEETYPVGKQKIRQMLISKKAYNVITGVELLPPCNSVALSVLQEDWHH
jgi:hypothetical protein